VAAVGEQGYFPRDSSILRRVHEQHLVALHFGQRALCIGALAPLNYVGTSQHSYAKLTPFKRLAHTGQAFEQVFFGTREEADRVLAYVAKLHQQVQGALPEDAGRFPAGTPYSAFDTDLMLWTVGVIADSAQTFYELLVRRLSPAEREALWQDYLRFGELFGMPREAAPRTYAEFRAYWNDELAAPDVHLTDEARQIGLEIMFGIPVPKRSAPAMRVHNLIMLGMLPPPVRDLYELSYSPAHAAAFRSVVAGVRASRPLTPAPIRRGWNTRFFEDVARTERHRLTRTADRTGTPA
jgi:uncharacterized protein (DUF2236 family)